MKILRRSLWALFLSLIVSTAESAAVSEMIVVDQLGYRSTAEKWVMIKNPQVGYDSALSYVPGASVELRRSSDLALMQTINLTAWNGGATDNNFSGDQVWQGQFTGFTVPGTYHVYDPTNDRQSYPFDIRDDVYSAPLEASLKSFFYNRSNIAITVINGGAWTHALDHTQQTSAHLYDNSLGGDQGAGTARDISGGWFDAGDYRKYTAWMANAIWDLAYAFEWFPDRFSDATNIPESGNGVPDILDEIKWELDWMLKMQRGDGALYSGCFVVQGINGTPGSGQGDPAIDDRQYFYANASTAATASGAASFAIGARLFAPYAASYPGYVIALQTAAENAWAYLAANPANIQYDATNFDNASSNQDASNDAQTRFQAAAELFKLTGSAVYQAYCDANYNSAATSDGGWHQPILDGYFETGASSKMQRGLVSYASAPGATAAPVAAIHNSLEAGADTVVSQQPNDPYRSHMWGGHYTWGSNGMKVHWAWLPIWAAQLGVNAAKTANYWNIAEGYVHWFHGLNPTGYNFLTQSQVYGADKPITEFYHSWFYDGTVWDSNPAPGFLAGGPNQNFSPDASYAGPPLQPPQNQPPMKSYLDWNTSWPENSWEVTENSTGYQSRHVFLMAAFAAPAGPLPTATPSPTQTPFLGSPTHTPTNTPSPTATVTVCAVDLNMAETLGENGTWSGPNGLISLSVSAPCVSQGSGAVSVNITYTATWQDNFALLGGFTPSDWSNVQAVELDFYVDPGSSPFTAWGTLSLWADDAAAGEWYQQIAAGQALAAGSNSLVLPLDWGLGTLTSASSLSNIRFILSSDGVPGTGTVCFDNMRLILAGCSAPLTASPSATVTPSNTQAATATATPSPSPSNSPTVTVSLTFTGTPSSSLSATQTPGDSPTYTPSATSSPTLSPVNSPTPTPSATSTSSATASPTMTLTATFSETAMGTFTYTPTYSVSPTETPSATISPTSTASPSASSSLTQTGSPTETPADSPSATASASSSPTETMVVTATATLSSSPTPLGTLTDSPTASPTATTTMCPTDTEIYSSSPQIIPAGAVGQTLSLSRGTCVGWPGAGVMEFTIPAAFPAPQDSDPTGTAGYVSLNLTNATGSMSIVGRVVTINLTSFPPMGNVELIYGDTGGGANPAAGVDSPAAGFYPVGVREDQGGGWIVRDFGPFYTGTWTVQASSPTTTATQTVVMPTSTSTPADSATATAVNTQTHTPTFTVTAMPENTLTPTATLTVTPYEEKELRVEQALAAPNPVGAAGGMMMVKLAGGADEIEMKIFTPGMTAVLEETFAGPWRGWARVKMPDAFVQTAANGVYYCKLTAKRGEADSAPVTVKFLLLK